MVLAVFSVESETDSRESGNALENLFQCFANFRELRPGRQCEIEAFRKPVVAKVAALECGATLEDKKLTEPALAQANEKLRSQISRFSRTVVETNRDRPFAQASLRSPIVVSLNCGSPRNSEIWPQPFNTTVSDSFA